MNKLSVLSVSQSVTQQFISMLSESSNEGKSMPFIQFENESALVWFGILAMSLALGYVIYKAIMMRKKEQRDTNLLKEYLGKFPDEPAPPRSHGPVEKGRSTRNV
ncbi:hypothetical protein T4D_9918 [Trichinella pseudospiralis]|uniref:Uncharacterized protein n=1 Tax=Trichinella pseudospiralis TaxID=6337 RepID=A0A0V1F475_TRIPS|nr:hypothetical protein T4D_9918 [Trichinella pseudospiralis]